MTKVIFIGDGSHQIPGVPLSDHECSEEEAYQRVASGLFRFEDAALKEEMDTLIAESLYWSDPNAEVDEEATAKMQRKAAKETHD